MSLFYYKNAAFKKGYCNGVELVDGFYNGIEYRQGLQYNGVVTYLTPNLTLSQYGITIQNTEPIQTIALSYNGDGAVSVQSSNSSVVTASLSGSTITLTMVSAGSATVTVSATRGARYEAASASISVRTVNTTPATVQFTVSIMNVTRTYSCQQVPWTNVPTLTPVSGNSNIAAYVTSAGKLAVNYWTTKDEQNGSYYGLADNIGTQPTNGATYVVTNYTWN